MQLLQLLVVTVFTSCQNYHFGLGKSICKSKYINALAVHKCSTNKPVHDSKGIQLNGEYNFDFKLDNLHINHYMFMSEQYYKDVKCIRGGGQSGHCRKYTMEFFYKHCDKNNLVEDYELKNKTYN